MRCSVIALIGDVHAIHIIQRYPEECRIKMRLSGRAFVTFQSIIRGAAMNFENKTKTLAESAFFSCRRESSSTFNKKEAQRIAFLS